MIKVAKFGGSSVAGPEQFHRVKAIVEADPSRRIVVASAAGKRSGDDHKLTDLLYLCHAHITYGVSCDEIFGAIQQRFVEIRDTLGLSLDIESELDALGRRLNRDMSVDELVSRGEYFTSRLLAEYLGFRFVEPVIRKQVFRKDDMEPSGAPHTCEIDDKATMTNLLHFTSVNVL